MALKFLDSRPDYSNPLDGYKTLNAGEQATWGAPENDRKSFDAVRAWSEPELAIPVGELPVGTPGNDTLVKFLTFLGDPIIWRVIGRDLETMKDEDGNQLENCTTLLADKILAYRCFDAREPSSSYTGLKSYGNNDYGVSNIRQWLNSEAGPGKWYSAQHVHDMPPESDYVRDAANPYNDKPGFLNESTSAQRDLLMRTKRFYVYQENKGNTQFCVDRIFLLTMTELRLQNLKNDGVEIPYFSDYTATETVPTESAKTDYTPKRQGFDPRYWSASHEVSSNVGSFYNVWCAGVGTSTYGWHYDAVGAYDGAYCGVRPACNIPSTTLLSPKPDEDGCYVVLV